MKNLYTLRVYPAGNGREVYRVIEIGGDATLDRLCEVIMDAFDFIHEHLYEFCMDNRMYSEFSYQVDPEDDEPSTDISLDDIHLMVGQKFTLHYDYGDDWMFPITVSKIQQTSDPGEPRVIKSKGAVQQYPDWDWDWDEDEE